MGPVSVLAGAPFPLPLLARVCILSDSPHERFGCDVIDRQVNEGKSILHEEFLFDQAMLYGLSGSTGSRSR